MSEQFRFRLFLALFISGVAAVLDRLYFRLLLLPESAYFKPVIVSNFLDGRILLLFAVTCAPLLFVSNKLTWKRIAPQSIRLLIVVIAITIAWAFSTYAFNFYYDQPHHVDRIVLILLAVGVYLHPAFVPPFIAVAIAITYQFHHPFGRFTWTDKRLLYELLILCNAYLLVEAFFYMMKRYVRKITLPPIWQSFLFLALCLHAATYLNPALLKLELNWLQHDNLANLAAASYMNGWLAHVSAETAISILQIIERINTPLLLITLITELGVVFMFVHRRAAIYLLIAANFLHIGIFLSSGIFFWKWIILNLTLVWVIWQLTERRSAFTFGREQLLLSFAFIPLSLWLWQPIQLGWYDTPLAHTFELRGIDTDGQTYAIPRFQMAPYDVLFAQNRFPYLQPEPLVVGTYGATLDQSLLGQSEAIPLDYEQLVENFGQVRYNPDASERFDQFIKIYFANRNEQLNASFVWQRFAAPRHIWNMTHNGTTAYNQSEPLQTIHVQFATQHYDGNQIQTVERSIVRVIEIHHE